MREKERNRQPLNLGMPSLVWYNCFFDRHLVVNMVQAEKKSFELSNFLFLIQEKGYLNN